MNNKPESTTKYAVVEYHQIPIAPQNFIRILSVVSPILNTVMSNYNVND